MKGKRISALILTTALCAGMVTTVPALETSESRKQELPSYFNLCDKGLVTPVKDQNPFGTCWAHGTINIMETAVLKEAGMTYDEAAAEGSAVAPYTDLSEKHLSWFAYQALPASVDPSQAGEGMIVKNQEMDPCAVYDKGGFGCYGDAVFTTGAGPATEEAFPYEGKDGIRQWEYLEAHKDEIIAEEVESGWYTEEEALEAFNIMLENAKRSNEPTYYDDWTLDEADRQVDSPITLVDSNYLPGTVMTDQNYEYAGLDVAAVNNIKQELYTDHAIAASYNQNDEFFNYENWAIYTPVITWANHRISIVGWDDNYKKENFASVGIEDYENILPEGDGAWIVKNSWGNYHEYDPSEEDGELTPSQWGVDDTGYFYISYYDRTIREFESVDISLDLEGENKEKINQYNYNVPDGYGYFTSDKETSSANVFKTTENERITALATRTYAENSRIKMEIYLLNDNAANPKDGVCLYTVNDSFSYPGYHRVDLNDDVYVPAGKSYSVVVTETVTYNGNGVTYIRGEDVAACPTEKGYAKAIDDLVEYKWIVVNPGESFTYKNGVWTDLYDNYEYDLTLDNLSQMFNGKVDDEFCISHFGVSFKEAQKKFVQRADNYCIKSFTVSAPEYTPESEDPKNVIEGKSYTAGTGALCASYRVTDKTNYFVVYRMPEGTDYSSTAKIPDEVELQDGNVYYVVGIDENAFKNYPQVKKLVINTPYLNKNETKGCLLSSKVNTVVIKGSSKSETKNMKKHYKSYFTKKWCGKKVTVK